MALRGVQRFQKALQRRLIGFCSRFEKGLMPEP